MERIKTKTSILENHDGLTMVRIEEKCYITTVEEFLTEVEGITRTTFEEERVTTEKYPRFKEFLDSFVNSLPANSEHHINDIIVHSYMREFVTSFAVDNRIAITVEVSLFVEIYSLIKQTGGLKYFLYSARDEVYYSKPFFNNLQNFTSEYKYPLVLSGGS